MRPRRVKMDDVDLSFTTEALEAIAGHAITRKMGARALRSIVESIMLDIMYVAPSELAHQKVLIDVGHVRRVIAKDTAQASPSLEVLSAGNDEDVARKVA